MNRTGTKSKNAVRQKKTVKQKAPAGEIARRVGRIVVTLMLVAVIIGCVVVGAMTLYIVNFVKPYNIDLSDAKLKFTSFIYAGDSATNPTELAQVSGDENRIWVDLGGVPKNLTNAIISTEDKRFNEHEGVDFRRTAGSVANYFLHFNKVTSGGSTLTQQLIKNYEGNVTNRTVDIKIREIITAVDMEKRYSKDQILEAYVNTITLGQGIYGVQAASNIYFGKDVKDLDLAQCAALTAVIRLPNTTYNPYLHPDNVKKRSLLVLKNMLDQKMITKDQYTQAANEKLTYNSKKTTVRSWFVDQVINDVVSDLKAKKGYTTDYARQMVYTQGLRIYTTESPSVQSAMDAVYQNAQSKYFKSYQNTYFNSSMVITDYSGKVLGMEGGTGQKTGNMVLNRATAAYRQPGSSFKPIATYAIALENNIINWSTLFQDSPPIDNWANTGRPGPKDDEAYSYLNMPVVQALAESRNTIAVRIEQSVLPINSYNFLTKKLGFLAYDGTNSTTKQATKNGLYRDYDGTGLGISMGMLHIGVTAEEMAGAYQIFGNGGVFTKPYTYTKVTDADGNIILQNNPASIQVISPETSTIMNKLLQQVVTNPDPLATGHAAALPNCPVAGKTGTTSDNKDRWWVGLTPEYVGAVWTGYDQPEVLHTSGNPAITVWHDIMQALEKNHDPSKDFTESGNVVQEAYNPATGQVDPSGTAAGWYKEDDSQVLALQNAPVSSSSPAADSSSSPSSSSPQ